MSKRFIILILCLSLILGSSVPVFAVSTDSAIKSKSLLSVSDTRATGSDYSQDIYNYIVGTNGFPAISSGITAVRNLITNHFYRNSGFTLYYWGANSGISTATSGNGYFSNYLASAFTNISQLIAQNNEQVWDTKQYLVQQKALISDIHEILTTDGGINLNLEHWSDIFYPDNTHWDRPTSDQWNYFYTNYVGYNGSLTSESFRSSNIFYQLKRYFVNNNNSLGTIGMFLGADTLYNASADYPLTNYDLTTSSTPKKSIWWDIRAIGANLSEPLHRLAFVFASDEEIAARQAAQANTDAVVDDFISSSGSGSVSATNLGDMASGSAAIKSALSSNASASDAFGVFNNDSSIWDWFTQGTKDSFDNVSRTRDSSTYTSYYEDYISKVLQGVNENERR